MKFDSPNGMPNGMENTPDPIADSMELVICAQQMCWLEGAPVALVAGALFMPATEAGVGIVLEFQNLSEKVIDQLHFSLVSGDRNEKEIRNDSGFLYPDLDANPAETFGAKFMIRLPEQDIRTWVATVDRVIYADGSVWENAEDKPCVPLARQYAPSSLGKGEERYRQSVPEKSQCYLAEPHGTWWRCGCGQINRDISRPCIRCDAALETLLKAARLSTQ